MRLGKRAGTVGAGSKKGLLDHLARFFLQALLLLALLPLLLEALLLLLSYYHDAARRELLLLLALLLLLLQAPLLSLAPLELVAADVAIARPFRRASV